ncbi:MAG: PQQ-binding-like beta-propeller repeat protein [Candidatus Heimdallarchaeota archaeon]|nr:PQQ-binding-like beta-propeller repeat protein [Candidatus Heimdallarchaeota archaeon]
MVRRRLFFILGITSLILALFSQPTHATDPSILWEDTETSNLMQSTAVLFDIGGGGVLDVIVGSDDGSLYAFNGEDGSLIWEVSFTGAIKTPALGDLDQDGTDELVVTTSDSNITVLNPHDGTKIWSLKSGTGHIYSPALADVDGDGELEVIFGTQSLHAVVANADGSILWNVTLGQVLRSPAVGDLDGDGTVEVVFPGYGGTLWVRKGIDGSVFWDYTGTGQYTSRPVIADLDNDGYSEVIAPSLGGIVALNYDGALRWVTSYTMYYFSSPAIYDIDDDDYLDVIFGDAYGHIYSLSGYDGSLILDVNALGFQTSPALADVDGDNVLDLIFGGKDGNVYVVNMSTQIITYQTDLSYGITAGATMGDLNKDGKIEGMFGNSITMAATDGNFYAITYPSSGFRIFWQGDGGLFTRTGNYADIDADHDGLSRYSEIIAFTDPNNPDTDGDGTPDGEEIEAGTLAYTILSSSTTESTSDTTSDTTSTTDENVTETITVTETEQHTVTVNTTVTDSHTVTEPPVTEATTFYSTVDGTNSIIETITNTVDLTNIVTSEVIETIQKSELPLSWSFFLAPPVILYIRRRRK